MERLLELSAKQEAAGDGDAPWPPHYRKQGGGPTRAPPSTRRTRPLVEIGRSDKLEEAMAGLERWKERHPKAAAHLDPADVLVDRMRGSSSLWTRIRVNLEHVPAGCGRSRRHWTRTRLRAKTTRPPTGRSRRQR